MNNTLTPPLTDRMSWKKLLVSAERSIGKNYSFYEAPEPDYCDRLLKDYGGDMDKLANEVIKLMLLEAKEGYANPSCWAVLKEGATVLHHLQQNGYTPEDDWEQIIDVLWKVMGEFSQGSWSAFAEAQQNNSSPTTTWKHIKFVIDAILWTLYKIPGEADGQIERFFNSKMSEYWKAFIVFWVEIWGEYQDDREPYFQKKDYRGNHKLTTYQLLIYRLKHWQTEFPAHPNKAKETVTFLDTHRQQFPADKAIRKSLFDTLFQYLQESGEEDAAEVGLITIKRILGDEDTFEFLTHREDLDRRERGGLLIQTFEEEELHERWKTSIKTQRKILPDLMAALKHDELDVREKAIQFLQSYPTELFKHLRYIESLEPEEKQGDSHLVFKSIARIFGEDTAKRLLENISFTPLQKGKLLLSTPRVLEARWDAKDEPNHDTLLPVILAAVEDGDPKVQALASNFLKRKSADIQRKLDLLIKDLEDEDKASEMIVSAIEFGSDAALKTILEKCSNWVASDQNATLVDRAAQKARYTPGAVLALINLLNNKQDYHKNEDVKKYVRRRTLEDQQNPTILRVFQDDELSKNELDQHTIEEIYKWCYSKKEDSKSYADLVISQDEQIRKRDGSLKPRPVFDLARSILKLLEQAEMKERELVVQKWITQLLSEMSDRWFFEGKTETYAEIKSQLERLAIEPLSKRLPQEQNLDIRENLVKILGNIGGRVAVDALVRTVTGEERERAARQELLSEYYLKPSKARSEEAAILLNDAVDNAKQTMRLLQLLNVATFALGVTLILGGVTIAIASEEMGGRVTGVLSGLGGLAAILTQFLKDPLDRIQRAMADLVQVQTAFTTFIWELNLNGTYIQSQYVAEGILNDFDLRQTIGRIDHAMERTMHLIQVYADGEKTGLPPQLHYLIPAKEGKSVSLTLIGTNLKGINADKEKVALAINNQSVEATLHMWSDQHATFLVSGEVLEKYRHAPRIWVSLQLNELESNPLPYLLELDAPATTKPVKEAKTADA